MAADDQEIEVKFSVSKEVFEEALLRTKKLVPLHGKSAQKDEYFTPLHRNFVSPEFPFEWLSIRERGGKTILNYKHFYPENAAIVTHCDEYETVVEDSSKLKKIFDALNIKSLVVVKKDRETYNISGEFEIAFDTMEDLGYFIEIEAMKNLGDVQKTRQLIFGLAKKLGLDVNAGDNRGYPYLLMKKRGLV
jgi:predicted adenylyl cyclase CyaB